MNRLDEELRRALRREAPPAGFAERVLARVAAEGQTPGRWARLAAHLPTPRIRWVAAAAVLCIAILSGLTYQRQQRIQAEGERAKQQLMLALRITAEELRTVHEKVQGLHLPQGPEGRNP